VTVATTPAPFQGMTVGAYRILGKLGEGGMGTVYLAEHALLGRRAAIKVLLPELSRHPEVVQRFFNEARAVTAVADPGIVQIFDFGIHGDGSAYIVMELLEGESLDARLRRLGRIPPHDALRIMQQLASSLGAAHAKGVVHRDLKPENLFIVGDPAVTGGERVKLLDFGIAKLRSNEPGMLKTQTGMLIGTPVYMSPEQCRGAGDIDHRSDIYSLGCVLFCMLAGRPPFDGEGTGELIAAHLMKPAPALSAVVAGLPGELDAVIARCLAKSPGGRFSSMPEFARAIAGAEQQLRGVARSAAYVVTMPAGPSPLRRSPVTTLRASTGEISMLSGRSLEFSSPRLAPSRDRKLGWIAGLLAAGVVIGGAAFIVRGGPRSPGASAVVPAAVPLPASAPDLAAASAPAAPAPAAPAPAVPAPAAAVVSPRDAGTLEVAAPGPASAPVAGAPASPAATAPAAPIDGVRSGARPRAPSDAGRVRPANKRSPARAKDPTDHSRADQVVPVSSPAPAPAPAPGGVDRGD